jgi:hypothetical protein
MFESAVQNGGCDKSSALKLQEVRGVGRLFRRGFTQLATPKPHPFCSMKISKQQQQLLADWILQFTNMMSISE